MKKILVVGQTPPPYGGQAIMIKRMLDGVYNNATLFHVRMAFSKDMDDMGRWRVGKFFHAAKILFEIIWVRFRHGANVLYFPPSGPDVGPMLRDLLILLPIRWMFNKTIFHFHAAGSSELYPELPVFLRTLYRWGYFKPDIAIQLSCFNPDDSGFLQSKIKYIIPNGIEDDYLTIGCPSKAKHSVCTILFVGLVCESKGILVLIDAIRILKENGLFVKVNVVGKFSSESFKKKVYEIITNNRLEEYFEFKGVLTGIAKHEQYLNADIFCFPTFFESESFSLVVAEAMQFCVPVIVTKWRGVQSLVRDGENGFLVPIHDSQAVANKIMLLVADPIIRKKMGEIGRSIYLQEYAVEKFYQRMDDCFANV